MIYFASDHAGYKMKDSLKEFLSVRGVQFMDLGPRVYLPDDDYPDYVLPCARMVAAAGPDARGIVLGFSGTGEAMAANKVRGVRAAVYAGGSLEIVRLSRAHNDANVLAIGAGFVSVKQANQAIWLWLHTAFEQGRHVRRLAKLAAGEVNK